MTASLMAQAFWSIDPTRVFRKSRLSQLEKRFRPLDHGNECLNIQRTSPTLRCWIVNIGETVFASLAAMRTLNSARSADELFQRCGERFAAVFAQEFKDHGYRHDGLLNRARDCGEDIVGVCADQSDRTDHDHENHGQHYRVFSDVLCGIVGPEQRGEHWEELLSGVFMRAP
jgi:hypothetical protein